MYLYNIHTHKVEFDKEGYSVKYILNTSPEDFSNKYQIHSDSYFSCGIHPWDAADSEKKLDLLKSIAAEPTIVAIGEIGLDKLKGPDLEIQVNTFRQQIKIAIAVQKPIIIHCVKAWDELIALYKEYKTNIPWIIHGYRGNPEQTKQLSKLGFKFSIGERFNEESIRLIPLHSLFCETDMSAIPICQVYFIVSSVLGIDFNQFVEIVGENMGKNFK